MAFRLKHWLGAVALSLLLVTVWRLPLEFVRPGRELAVSEEGARHQALTRELRDALAGLDQVRRVERLPDGALSAAGDGVSVFLPDGSLGTPGARQRLRDRVRAEVRALGTRDPEMVVAYGYDSDRGEETGPSVSRAGRLETYLGVHEGTPYCIQVVVARPEMVASLVEEDLDGRGWSRWTHSLLGPCALYATHGLAGPSVQKWMEAGGVDFAFGRRGGAAPPFRELPRRSILGLSALGWRGSVDSERCLTGDGEVCATIFLEPTSASRAGGAQRSLAVRTPAFFTRATSIGPFPTENWFLLSDLEREFGAEAFLRFWTSEDDVRSAFEEAFGVDLGEWLVTWLDRGPGIEVANPAPTLAATFESLLLVTLMTALAAAWQRRRQVH